MFYNSTGQTYNFNQDISSWDTSNVTNMTGMFLTRSGSIHRFNQPLNNWDVSNVTNMDWMFGVQFGTNGLDVISIKI